jgi:glycosyltransferase involved in cell wall biosynthesis
MDYADTTVIIPVKNEPATKKVVAEVLRGMPGSSVIVIYKGKLNMKSRPKNTKIIRQLDSGKGNAVRHAAKEVKTELMCLIDGDGTYSVQDLKRLVLLARNGADMALGNRLDGTDPEAMPGYIMFGNRVLSEVANILYGTNIKDSQTGLRVLHKKVFDSLDIHEPGFGIEEEMNIKAGRANYKIVEAPIKYRKRTGDSKQMKLPDGIKLLLINFKFLFD